MNLKTTEVEVGDTIEIHGDNEYWNGLKGTVIAIGHHRDREYPYHVVITDGHDKAPGAVGRLTDLPARHVKLVHKGTYRWGAVDLAVKNNFPDALDIFKSEISGNAVIMDAVGEFHRVMSDGTIDGA